MITILQFIAAALLPVLFVWLFRLLETKTVFGRAPYLARQIAIGVVFGGIAVLGTEFGIPVNGAVANCRDASVFAAGLLFGGPAGIIAGLIGGIERWFAVYWGVGEFTRVACTVSTIGAGFYSAALRKYLFDGRRPSWLLSFSVGFVGEVFHILMVFVTNLATTAKALAVVDACAAPMISANAISVMLAALVLDLFDRRHAVKEEADAGAAPKISHLVQKWLLLTVAVSFVASSVFVFALQNTLSEQQTADALNHALDSVAADIRDAVASEEDVGSQLSAITKNRAIGDTGYVVILNSSRVVGMPQDKNSTNIKKEFIALSVPSLDEGVTYRATLRGTSSYYRVVREGDYFAVAVLPVEEAMRSRNIALYVNTFLEILIFAFLFGLVYRLIRRAVVDRIESVNRSLAKITAGDLDVTVDERASAEFASLSDDINSTVGTLKAYIAEASARIDKDLALAKNIQSSALPSIFPAFPKRHDFDVFASMFPAKDVGGDFYDFYLSGEDKLEFLIADVSGKGIPAAMFMMRAKTELKNRTGMGIPLSDVFTEGNNALCEGNDAGMFVTAWQGSVDLTSGRVSYANAGHNPPLVRRGDGSFEYLRGRAGFVLAGMEGVPYREQTFDLAPGDIVYLYTDGVTEATNAAGELFGEDRLLEVVNGAEITDAEALCRTVKSAIDAFVGEAPQFDDITMVALRFLGKPPAPTIRFEEAKFDDIGAVTAFLEEKLDALGFPMKSTVQINIAVDEIYSNIVKYGYPGEKKGPVEVALIVREDPRAVFVKFSDEGVPYNPLTKEDPDVTLSAEARQIGGLGIYMVKKTMDEIKYKYEDGKNILTIRKDYLNDEKHQNGLQDR